MDFSGPILGQTKQRVAILVDGDNFPCTGLSLVEAKASRLGDITIRRVFGDMALRADWAQETTYIATHCTTSAGKNRADMALVVAAMDFAHRGVATAFVVVSDDRDFGPLVSHLCEQGYRVEWFGKPKAGQDGKAKKSKKAGNASSSSSMLSQVRAVVLGGGLAGFPIHSLGPAMQKHSITVSDTPEKTWRAWLSSHPADFVCEPRGPDARVRIKR
jgi:hypothetical protein